MPTTRDLIERFQTNFGPEIGGFNQDLKDPPRLPSGIAAIDIASGGGIPLNRISLIYGEESSGKTNLSICYLREHQKRFPDRPCIFVDVEGTATTDWFVQMGVDTKKLVILRPEYAEQVVDMVTQLLVSDDCGLVVVDSLAAMLTASQIAASAEKATPGWSALLINQFCNKASSALKSSARTKTLPTILFINQVRYRVGVVFGNPETLPGGMAQKFLGCFRVRLTGKMVLDSKINKVLPIKMVTKGTIQKAKMPICGKNFEYEMTLVPHDGRKVGYADDWSVYSSYLREFGFLGKDGATYRLFDESFERVRDMKDFLLGDAGRVDSVRALLIHEMQKRGRGDL